MAQPESKIFVNANKYILGKSSVEELGPVMQANGVKKVLVVYGCGSVKRNGVYTRTVEMLQKASIEYEELWGVQPNPVLSKVREAITILKQKKDSINAVLAVGGGSVIDTAKAACTGALMEEDIWDAFQNKIPTPHKMIPLYVILTLSATASENDIGGVITNPPLKEKLGPAIGDVPVACAVDPTIQMSLPWRQVMCGAVDAMSHLMETMFSLDGKGITGRMLNFGVQRSILQSMDILLKNPTDYAARENFCWAASLGLRGEAQFMNDEDWNVHFLEHGISTWDDKIAHGEGLAAVAPWYYEYIYKHGICKDSLELWSKEVMGETDFLVGLEKFKQIMLSWKAPAGLLEIGIKDETAVDDIVAMYQRHLDIGYCSGVFKMTSAQAKEILMEALKH